MNSVYLIFCRRHLLLACLLLALVGCASVPTQYKEPPPLAVEARAALNEKVFHKAVALIDEHYFDPTYHGTDWQALHAKYQPMALAAQDSTALYTALNNMMGELGVSHLVAISPRQAHQVETRHVAATGFSMQYLEKKLVVTDVVPLGPAASAGVQPGWLVTARNGVPLPIAGDKFVTVLGQGVTYDFLDQHDQAHSLHFDPALLDFRRLDVRSLPGNMLYLRFDEFSFETLHWLSQQLKANAAAPGVVLDLRFNRGGNAAALTMALGEFRPVGTDSAMMDAGYTVDRKGKQDDRRSLPLFSAKYAGKLVILTDSTSVSAAEIFPRVMQYNKRATVIGRQTAGMVIISKFYDLPDEGLLQVPVIDYLGPDGQRLEGKGVTPDQVLPPATLAQRRAGEDPDLQAALVILNQQ